MELMNDYNRNKRILMKAGRDFTAIIAKDLLFWKRIVRKYPDCPENNRYMENVKSEYRIAKAMLLNAETAILKLEASKYE